MIFLAFLIPFLVYLITLCPTVYVGDSGELIVAAWSLGIPHPPGMPIWCLLTHPFTWLPFGSVAWRVNLASAFFSAAAALVIYLIIIESLKGKEKAGALAGCIAAIIFGLTKTVWVNAVQAEVYGLLAFFVALQIYLLIRWEGTKRKGFLYLFAFIYGLSITNQYLVLILAPMYFFWIITVLRRSKPQGMLPISAILLQMTRLVFPFLLGLAFFLYLPIRSRANPPIDWSNCETLRGFLNHITRRQYYENNIKVAGIYLPANIDFGGPLQFIVSLFYETGVFLRILFREFPWYINWLGWLGLFQLRKTQRHRFWLFLSGFLVTGPLLAFIFKQKLENNMFFFITYLPSFIIFAIWMGVGIYHFRPSRLSFPVRSVLATIVLLGFAFKNLPYCDRSGVTLARDYGVNIYKTLPQDAILFTEGSPSTFIMMYLGLVEKMRTDVTLVDRRGNVLVNVYQFPKLAPREMLIWRDKVERRLISQTARPIYYVYTLLGDKVKLPGVKFENVGLVERVLKPNQPLEAIDYWKEYKWSALEDGRVLYEIEARRLICEVYFHRAQDAFKAGDRKSAIMYYNKASQISDGWIQEVHNAIGADYYKRDMFKEAMAEYKLALIRNPGSAPLHSNLGLALMKLGDNEMAEDKFRKALEFDPKLHESHNNLGLIYYNQKRFEDSAREHRAALKLNPYYVDAYTGLGNALYELGRDEEAKETFLNALKIEPSCADAHRNLGVLLYYRLKDYKGAVEHFREYLRLFPDCADRALIEREISKVKN